MPGRPETVLLSKVPVRLGGTGLTQAPPEDAPLVGDGHGGYKFGFPIPEGEPAVIFDDSVATARSNIRGNRATNEAPIDKTATGELSISTTDDGGYGTKGDYATSLGGINNKVSGAQSVALGGQRNEVVGQGSLVTGDSNTVFGVNSVACGQGNTVGTTAALVGGTGNTDGPIITGTLAAGGTTVTVDALFGDLSNYIHNESLVLQSQQTFKDYVVTVFGNSFDGTNTILQLTAPFDGVTTSIKFATTVYGFGITGGLANFNMGTFCSVFGSGNITGVRCNGGDVSGQSCVVLGNASSAEGLTTTSCDDGTHSEGVDTFAGATGGHAEGVSTTASGKRSHAEGSQSQTGFLPDSCAIVPGGTTVTITGVDVTNHYKKNDTIYFVLQGGGAFPVFDIVYKVVATDPVFAAGNTTFDINSAIDNTTAAARCFDPLFGFVAHAEGEGTTAIGEASHAEGLNTITIGDNSHAEGNGTFTFGKASHAEGSTGTGYGDKSHSEGDSCTTGGTDSHAEGHFTRTGNALDAFTVPAGGVLITIAGDVTAKYANTDSILIVYGADFKSAAYKTIASVPAFGGVNTTFNINSSFDPGATSGFCVDTVKGRYAHAEGDTTVATGQAAHAEGTSTVASGASAHAEGDSAEARAAKSHAEGDRCLAIGVSSHAEGNQCHSTGDNSHAEGLGCVSDGDLSHAQGCRSNPIMQTAHAEAGGMFSTNGDAQHQRVILRGATPGVGVAEAAILHYGDLNDQEITVENHKAYMVEISLVAQKMGVGAGALQAIMQKIAGLVTVNSAGAVTITGALAEFAQVTVGAGLVGSTLVMSSVAANKLRVTFTVGAGLTTQTQISAKVQLQEVLGT